MCIRFFSLSSFILLGLLFSNFLFSMNQVLILIFFVSIAYFLARTFDLLPNVKFFNKKAFLYFFWLIKEIFFSSIRVMKLILNSNFEVESVEQEIHHMQNCKKKIILYAYSITLTPGTVVLDIGKNSLVVHSLFKDAIIKLEQRDNMIIKKISYLVLY